MAFESLMHKSSDEYELFTQLAEEIQKNFAAYHGQSYFFHLKDTGAETSMIDDVRQFTDAGEIWHHTYITNDRHAFILFRTNPDSISLLLNGEHTFAEITVIAQSFKTIYGPTGSLVPGHRRSKLTAVERAKAFGFMQDSLEELRRKKSG